MPVDDRHDGDEEHHADHDAEQGEEALELLHADLLEGEPDGFEEGHGRLDGWGTGLRIAGREVSAGLHCAYWYGRAVSEAGLRKVLATLTRDALASGARMPVPYQVPATHVLV